MSRQLLRHQLQEEGWGRLVCLAVLVVSVMFLLATPSALAQQGPTPTLDQVNAVARELYCPLCNGVRLDTCDLQACIQMRQVISDKLAAGVPKEQIKQEFVAEYGPKVLGEPPRSGLDLLAWVVPIVAIVAGGAWLAVTARRWTRTPAGAAGSSAGVASSGPAVTDGQADTSAAGTDTYLAQVEADLNELE